MHKTAVALPDPLVATVRRLLLLTLAVLALAASGAAWADPPGRVGRVADTDGTVWSYDDDEGEWVQARRNQPVTEGDRFSVERGGRATLQVGSATVRLDGATEVEFTRLDDDRIHLRLHGGSVALRVRGDDRARDFAVLTDEGRYEPLRAGRYRIDAHANGANAANGGSHGAALSGTLRFEARDSLLDIAAGQRAEFWSERGTTHYAWVQPLDDRFADWVAREDREDDREQRNRYVSPEMTGSEDLDRYGRWDRSPEYGTIWYPTTVAAGWAPYRHGQWAYVRPWGWTWVDDAPWGFAPFHYGRWVSDGGRWGWVPGQYVARPVYAPALVGWFGGSNVSVSIGIGPSVGWVPLAPRDIYYPGYSVSPIYLRHVNVTHGRWHGPNPRYERTRPTGPIMYTNQGVAGGVTVVPRDALRPRQPISRAAVQVDPRQVQRWTAQPTLQVAPPQRVATAPAVVPAAPGAVRPTPWQQRGGGNNAGRNDGGDARPGAGLPRGGLAPRGDVVEQREQRRDGRFERGDERRAVREPSMAAPVAPSPSPAQSPAVVERPARVERPVTSQPAPPAAAQRPSREQDNSPRGRGGPEREGREPRERPQDRRSAPQAQVSPVQVPQVRVPSVQVPSVQVPSVQVPSVQVPQVQVPQAQPPGQARNNDDRGGRGNGRGQQER